MKSIKQMTADEIAVAKTHLPIYGATMISRYDTYSDIEDFKPSELELTIIELERKGYSLHRYYTRKPVKQ